MGVLQPRGDPDLPEEPLGAEGSASSGWRTLSATGRSCLRSWARYTVAIPPRPSSRSIGYTGKGLLELGAEVQVRPL